jgi:hypothetical protein
MTRQQTLAVGLLAFGATGFLVSTVAYGSRPVAAHSYALAMHVGSPSSPASGVKTASGAQLDCRALYSLANLTFGRDCRRAGAKVALGD